MKYSVRLTDIAYGELEEVLQSLDQFAEREALTPEQLLEIDPLAELLGADLQVVIDRKNNPVYEVLLSLDAVRSLAHWFAGKVDDFRYYVSEGDNVRKELSNFESALVSANNVLVEVGETPVRVTRTYEPNHEARAEVERQSVNAEELGLAKLLRPLL